MWGMSAIFPRVSVHIASCVRAQNGSGECFLRESGESCLGNDGDVAEATSSRNAARRLPLQTLRFGRTPSISTGLALEGSVQQLQGAARDERMGLTATKCRYWRTTKQRQAANAERDSYDGESS